MKKILGRALFCALLALLTACVFSSALAAPRNIYPALYTQPDGTSFEATLEGNSEYSWISVDNGYALVRGSSGYWCYALPDGDSFKAGPAYPSDAAPVDALSSSDMYALLPIEQAAMGDELIEANSLSARGSMLGSKKTLVLLVDTNDASIRQSDSFWANRIFSVGGVAPNASVRDYYRAVSNNQIDLVPAAESKGTQNDGVVRVKVRMSHPGTDYYDCNSLVSNALIQANQYVNFASFDSNGDGRVLPDELHIVTIVGGYEASASSSYSPAVWAHYMQYSNGLVTCDGVRLAYGSVRVGEYMFASTPLHIGTIAHELGHSMGLYDLYDTDNSSRGVGGHSLMGSGSWGLILEPGDCPVYLDAFSRTYLGIITPKVVSSGSYQVNAASGSNANILRVNTSNSNEYFLLENRQFTGFDRGLNFFMNSSAKGGIAIWHIDESLYGYNCNADENHKAVGIAEANEGVLGYSQLDNNYSIGYDHYYSNNINTEFNGSTRPNSKLYSGAASGVSVSVPGASAASMTVTIGGAQATPIPTASAIDQYETNNSFASATPIYGYASLKATIYGIDDYDYYKLRLDNTGNAIIIMSPPAGLDFDIYLYNSNRVEIANSRKSADKTEIITAYLNGGSDYYLLVRGYQSAYSPLQYLLSIKPYGQSLPSPTPTIRPTAVPTAVPTGSPLGDAYEPNDFLRQATVLTGPVYATIHNSSDVDFFKLTVPYLSRVKINMEPAADRDYDLYLYKSNGSMVTSSRKFGNETEQISRYLPAGDYYIKVRGYNNAYSLDFYHLTYEMTGIGPTSSPTDRPTATPVVTPAVTPAATSTPPSSSGDMYEPNNYIYQAYGISPNSLRATIHIPGDNDYYSFDLPYSTTTVIIMEPVEGRNYDLSLYNSSGVQIYSSNKSGDRSELIRQYLTAGKYYILVNGCNGAYDAVNEYMLRLYASPVSTSTPTAAPTRTPIPTVKPTRTPIPTVIPTRTPIPTVKPTRTPIPTVIPTRTPSPTATPIPVGSTKYRAVLIGNYNYPGNMLDGPVNDVEALRQTLLQMNYNGSSFTSINRYTNMNQTGISNSIAQAAASADSDDVTFFYYSGHGALSNGTAYIVGVDFSYISVNTLESWLSQIPGTVVVLLDSCHSGGFINKAPGIADEFDSARFTQSVINAFSSSSASAARGYLTGSKYKVLAACAKSESSWEGTLTINGSRVVRGYFTYAVECAAEYDSSYMYADTNYNGRVSLQELYEFTYEGVNYMMYGDDETQTVQVYPMNDSFTIFDR